MVQQSSCSGDLPQLIVCVTIYAYFYIQILGQKIHIILYKAVH